MKPLLPAALLFTCFLALAISSSLRCDLTPAGITAERTRKDVGRYRIEISGNPEAYVAGEQYTGEYRFNFAWRRRRLNLGITSVVGIYTSNEGIKVRGNV